MKLVNKVLALILVVCMLLPFAVACGDTGSKDTVTDKATESKTETATESKTETASESETEDPLETAYCYYIAEDGEYICYKSFDEAVEDNPAGAELFIQGDYASETSVTLPADAHFVIHFAQDGAFVYNFTSGVLYEYVISGFSGYIYFSQMEDILTMDVAGVNRHNGIFWNFHETAELATGRYLITNLNAADEMLDPDYAWEKTHEIDMFGTPYVFYSSNDGRLYYTIADACTTDIIGNTCNCDIINDYYVPEEVDVPVGGAAAPGYRISYSWHLVPVKWSFGITYDDNMSEELHGYCYYSSLGRICGVPNLQDTYLYVWSDVEGLRPGKYYMELADATNSAIEVFDGDGLLTETTVGFYHLTHVDEIWNFAPEWNDFWEENPGWKAQYPEWVAEHPNANLPE